MNNKKEYIEAQNKLRAFDKKKYDVDSSANRYIEKLQNIYSKRLFRDAQEENLLLDVLGKYIYFEAVIPSRNHRLYGPGSDALSLAETYGIIYSLSPAYANSLIVSGIDEDPSKFSTKEESAILFGKGSTCHTNALVRSDLYEEFQ